MTTSNLNQVTVTAVESILTIEPDRFRDRFMEYVTESDHDGWEGFTPSQVSAIDQFLIDLIKYVTV